MRDGEDVVTAAKRWLTGDMADTLPVHQLLAGLVDEVDRLNARLRAMEHPFKPEEHERFPIRTALHTRTVDITQDHDVRMNKRRLVEVDDAGNVIREWTQR